MAPSHDLEKGLDFGASVEPLSPTMPHVIHEKPSTETLQATPSFEYDITSKSPFSAFYSHPITRTSTEQLNQSSTVAVNVQDLEDARHNRRYSSEPRTSIGVTPSKECSMWPGQVALGKKKKELERSKVCVPLRGLSKKQRIWVKIVIAILIVGAAVGIGIGVSKAVGAGVWKNENSTTTIGG